MSRDTKQLLEDGVGAVALAIFFAILIFLPAILGTN